MARSLRRGGASELSRVAGGLRSRAAEDGSMWRASQPFSARARTRWVSDGLQMRQDVATSQSCGATSALCSLPFFLRYRDAFKLDFSAAALSTRRKELVKVVTRSYNSMCVRCSHNELDIWLLLSFSMLVEFLLAVSKRKKIDICSCLSVVRFANGPKRPMGHLLRGEKINFFIRDIDDPTRPAAPMESSPSAAQNLPGAA